MKRTTDEKSIEILLLEYGFLRDLDGSLWDFYGFFTGCRKEGFVKFMGFYGKIMGFYGKNMGFYGTIWDILTFGPKKTSKIGRT